MAYKRRVIAIEADCSDDGLQLAYRLVNPWKNDLSESGLYLRYVHDETAVKVLVFQAENIDPLPTDVCISCVGWVCDEFDIFPMIKGGGT